jgi:hypothetical protein
MRQIIKHTTDESCWLLVDGKVGTSWIGHLLVT